MPASIPSPPSKPAPARVPLEPGAIVGDRYRVVQLLGEGRTGTVYVVEHVLLQKRVALKVLHPELTDTPEGVARFEREAMATARVEHPNVAAAIDFGKLQDGSRYLALEYVEGTHLRSVIEKGPLEIKRALHIAEQIAAALAAAQALEIVHRDLKPENVILITRGDDPDFVKIIDFGMARIAVDDGPYGGPQALTKAGAVFGTPEYIPPEQGIGQKVDSRADLYALGVMLFEMLTGVRPYAERADLGVLAQQLTLPVPTFAERAPHVQVAEPVQRLVYRLLARRPQERVQRADELETLLRQLLEGEQPALLAPAAPLDPLPAFALNTQLQVPEAPPPSGSGDRAPPASALPASAPPASALPASALPASAPPASALPASALPASALPASALPASALPASALPASALPASALPASALPASALPASALPPAAPGIALPPTPNTGSSAAPATAAGNARVSAALALSRKVRESFSKITRVVGRRRDSLPEPLRSWLLRVPAAIIVVAGILLLLLLFIQVGVWLHRVGSDRVAADAATSANATSDFVIETTVRSAPVAPSESVVAPVRATETDANDPAAMIRAAEAKLDEGRDTDAVSAVARLLAKHPDRRNDEQVARILFRTASSNTAAAANNTFSLLQGTMAAQGAEILYQLAIDKSVPSHVRSRAEKWLHTPQFDRAASDALRVAARLRFASTCETKHAMLPMAAKSGGAAALVYLRELQVETGCGLAGTSDCYACLRKDAQLKDAIAQIESRQ